MTEKRFEYNYLDGFQPYIYDIDDNHMMDDLKIICELLNHLNNENEQLKQFKEKVFVLLDEKIKHYEHKPFSVPVGQPMSVNFDADVDRLARLSELQDLEEELKE